MSKTVWTQTTQEFRAKWEGRKIGLEEIADAITDLLNIISNLEEKL